MEIRLDYTPQPKQMLLHSTVARQIFYGGAAGGGKSHGIRWDLINICLKNPGCQAYLFRKTLPELDDNHIKFIKLEIPPQVGTFSETRKVLEFRNGSALHFCYAERDQDIHRYLGAEMHVIGIDEASRMSEYQISFLRTRNRLGGWRPDPEWEKALPRFLLGSNPGGPAHNFLKETFVTAAPPGTLFYDRNMRDPTNPDDKGWTSMFIPAKIEDNAYMDEGYAASFSGLPPELARAYREGDWDAVVGQAVHNLSRERHLLRPFTPPGHWTRFMSIDWGTAAPFSVGWYAVSDGAYLAARDDWPERHLPAGAVIRYREWYGWNEKANQGCRMDAKAVARGIIQREAEAKEIMDYRVGDYAMWSSQDGPSVYENFRAVDERLVMRQALKEREHNYTELLARLAGNPEYMEDGTVDMEPMFYVTVNCTHWWRTVPVLTLDETNPEKGPNTREEDHCYDETVYALRSRPYMHTARSRWNDAYGMMARKARKQSVDPYRTRAQ